jgi:diguanylate cyclase (GGDEF)-like protein/PAS domain S-box-containing protein
MVRALLRRRAAARAPSLLSSASQEDHFRSAFTYSAIGMALVSLEGRWLAVNQSVSAMLGYTPEELLQTTFQALTHPDDLAADLEHVQRLIAGAIPTYTMEKRYLHKDGQIVCALLSVSLVRDGGGQPRYFISQIQDVTQRKQAEEALRHSEARLSLALAAVGQGTYDSDLATGAVRFSPECATMLGYPAEELSLTFDAVLSWVHPEDQAEALRARSEYLSGERAEYRSIFRFRTASGGWKWLLCLGAIVERDAEGRPTRLVGTYTDITERKRYEEQIEYLASHDTLTGLANRSVLEDRLARAMARTDRHANTLLAVLFLDLDRFKVVNDSLGHQLGDLLIKAVAERICGCTRTTDTVARRGGDEFVVVIEELGSPEDLLAVVRKIQQALAQPFAIGGHQIFTSVTIGATLYPTDGTTIERLLANADAAMYRAKLEGGGGFGFYTAELGERTIERFSMESALRQAVERDEFELYYQPQIELAGGRVVGMEALLRWHRPGLGFVLPGRFVPLAEDSGLIVPIGEWVLRSAAAQVRRWRAEGLSGVRVAINVSARQFWQGSLVRLVREVVEHYDLQPGDLELEVTETVIMRDIAQTIRLLVALRELGVLITIDDFGTGYSSLAYLQRLPLQRLKIDQSFVHEIGISASANELVRQIIDLAHAMSLAVVAEGIETVEQLGLLKQWDCDEGQGHYFARAQDVGACRQLLVAGCSPALKSSAA